MHAPNGFQTRDPNVHALKDCIILQNIVIEIIFAGTVISRHAFKYE
jgi:hypothetical protein